MSKPKNDKQCSFCGSKGKVYFSSIYKDYLCHKHYAVVYHGGTLTNRFRNDLNEIIIYEDSDYAEIILYNKSKQEKARAIIDIEDIEKVKNIKWSMHKEGYAVNKDSSKSVFLHQLILENYDKNTVVDHISKNRLDNRKINLRIASYAENQWNSSIPSNNTSGKKGVSFDKKTQKWYAYIGYLGKRIRLGYFEKYEDAVEIRLKAEEEYYKEFSPK